jgi:hypothetical protein
VGIAQRRGIGSGRKRVIAATTLWVEATSRGNGLEQRRFAAAVFADQERHPRRQRKVEAVAKQRQIERMLVRISLIRGQPQTAEKRLATS